MAAWFGEGLSKLTGEISNLTREVLSDTLSPEEVSEVAEDALERRPSNVPKLEEKVKVQEDQIVSLKRENDLLMKKLNDQLLSLDQASPRSTLGQSFHSGIDNDNASWSEFPDDEPTLPFPLQTGDDEFDDNSEDTQNELTLLKEKIENLVKENEDLLKETSELPELRSRIKQLHKENNLLIKSTDKFEQEVESSKKLLDDQKVSISRLEDQIRQLQNDLSNQNFTIDRLNQENERLREAVDSTQDENSNLSSGIEQLDIQHSRDIQDFMESKRETDKKNVLLQEEINDLKEKLKAASIQTDSELPIEPCRTGSDKTGSDNSDEISEAYDMLQNEYDELKQKFEEVKSKIKNENGNQADFELMPNIEDDTEKIKQLQEKVCQLKTKESDLHSRVSQLEDELNEKSNQITIRDHQLEENSKEIQQISKENDSLKKELKILENELEEKSNQITFRNHQIEENLIEIEIVSKENDCLKKELKTLNENSNDSAKLDSTLEENIKLNKIAKEQETLIVGLKEQLENVEISLKEKMDFDEWGKDTWGTEDSKKEFEELQKENKKLNAKICEQQDSLLEIKSQLKSVENELEQKKTEIEDWGQNDEYMSELNKQIEINKELSKKVEEYRAKIVELEEFLKQKEVESEDWNQNDNWEEEIFSEEIVILRKENETLKEKYSQQELFIEKLKAHSESLQKTLIEKEAEIEEWGANDTNMNTGEIVNLHEKIAKQDEVITELQARIKTAEEELKKKESDFEDWGDSWDVDHSSEISNLKSKLSAQDKIITELKAQENLNPRSYSSDVDSLREESTLLREKLSEQQHIISKLKHQLENTDGGSTIQQIRERDSRIEILSRENDGLRTRVEQLGLVIENNYASESEANTSTQDSTNERTAHLVVDKEKLEEDVNVLRKENVELKRKLEYTIDRQKDLEAEIDQLEKDSYALREQLESKIIVDESIEDTLKSEIKELQEKIVNKESIINQIKVEKQSSEEQYETLKEKFSQINEKLRSISDDVSVDIDTLIKNLQSKEEELCKLLDEKVFLDNIKLEKENLEIQLDNLNTNYQEKINSLIQTNSELEQKISELHNNIHNKSNEINDLNKRLILFEENNAFLQRTIVDLERNLDEKLKEFNDKEIKYNENIEMNCNTIKQLTEENNTLKADITAQTEMMHMIKNEQTQLASNPADNFATENELLKNELETLKIEIFQERENRNELQNALHTIENLKNVLCYKDEEINLKSIEMNALIKKCKMFEDKCVELESTIATKLHDFSTKEQINRSHLDEINKTLESVQAENLSLKEVNEQLKVLTDNLKHSSDSSLEERKHLEQYKQKINELEEKLKEEIETKSSLVESLESKIKALQEKTNSYALVEQELAQHKSQVEELEKVHNQLLAEKNQWIHEFENKNTTILDLQTKMNDYNNKIVHSKLIEAEVTELKKQISDLESTKQELLEQKESDSISTNALKIESKLLKDQLNEVKTTNESLMQEKNQLVANSNILQTQLAEYADKLCAQDNNYSQKLEEYEIVHKKLTKEILDQNKIIVNLNEKLKSLDSVDHNKTVLKDSNFTDLMKINEVKDKKIEELQKAVDRLLSEKYQFETEALALKNDFTLFENNIQLLNATTEDLQYQLQEKDKVIKELNEMKQSFFIGDSRDSVRYLDEEHIEELRELQIINKELQNESQKYATEVQNMKETISHLEHYNHQLQSQQRKTPDTNKELESIRSELSEQKARNETLMNTVTLKHEESVNYHREILRLNGVLGEESAKIKHLTTQITQLENQTKVQAETIEQKEKALRENQSQLALTKSQLEEVTQMVSSNDRPEADGEPAQEIVFAAQHATPLESNELIQRVQNLQDEKSLLLNEINELRLNQNSLHNENERLRKHLLTVEDGHTQELIKLETNIKELNQKLRDTEDRAKNSVTAYTSASIRSNQQVESLTSQVKYLSEQKDKMQEKLNAANELIGKHETSLTNLQIVLEQFQADKENEIAQKCEFLQTELKASYARNNELAQQISLLHNQLKEAMDNLSAMTKLSEQLEQKTKIISELSEKVNQLSEELTKSELKLKEVNNGGKVDKCLVNNMVVNFLTAPSKSRQQALQVLASVIDMSSQDRQRIGLERAAAFNPNQSISEAFVQFLEQESSPRASVQSSTPSSRRTSSTTSPLIFSENMLPNMPQFPIGRSSGSILKDVLHSDS